MTTPAAAGDDPFPTLNPSGQTALWRILDYASKGILWSWKTSREATMFARITTYKSKTDTLDEANEKVEGIKPEIMSIPGIKHWISCADKDGNCTLVAIYENKATLDAASPKARELFGRFADYYESDPQSHIYEVLHMESND